MITRAPLDLSTLPNRTRIHGEAIDFFIELHDVHRLVIENLSTSAARYKKDADNKRMELIFQSRDLVWIVLTKECFSAKEYNKLKAQARKIGPVQVLERINPNAYHIQLPPHICFPYHGDNDSSDFWSNPSNPAEPDAAQPVITSNPAADHNSSFV